MNQDNQRAAGYITDRLALPRGLAALFASLIPKDCTDPVAFLSSAVVPNPKHADLLPWIGNPDQLILRAAVIAVRVVENIGGPFRLSADWREEVIATALASLVRCVNTIRHDHPNIAACLYDSIDHDVRLRINRLRSEFEVPAYRKTPRIYAEPHERHTVASIYAAFYGAVRGDLQRAILELRWKYDGGVRLGLSAYCEDIARELGIPVPAVVEELELLQRRFLKQVNEMRRSRNNREYPALKAVPIHRIYRPHPSMRPYEVIHEPIPLVEFEEQEVAA
ncbi:hypothetical protein [Lacipirellula sp.]|uniref:hypothetical protein n=1 Tax=Lacipirellula sp. TaxID=2691419 RepID=UPI003D0F3650